MPVKAKRQRILLISRNLPPLTGGMERLSHRLHDGLVQEHEVTVIGPRGCARHLRSNIRTIELPQQPILFVILSILVAAGLAMKTRFDLCIGTNGLMAPACAAVKLLFRTRDIVLVHGLDLVAPSWIYQSIFVPLIKRADRIIANSTSTRSIAISKRVPAKKICIINPGVDPLPHSEHLEDTTTSADKTIVFVGRILTRKGLSGFISSSLREVAAHYGGRCRLVVVGDTPDDAVLKDYEEGARVKAALTKDISHLVQFMGKASDAELDQIYRKADVLILPLVEVRGDIEGFGMVVLEAAARGVPTVAFDIGGVVDAISEKNGVLVAPNDYDAFSRAVIEIMERRHLLRDSSIQHARSFHWENYLSAFNREISALLRANNPSAEQ